MRGGGEPSFPRWARGWPDYHRVNCSVLLSRHQEGGELGPYQCYTGAGPKGHIIDTGQDSPARSPILLWREIPMAWGTKTDSLTPTINPFLYARETKYLTLKDLDSYLILDG